MAKNPEKHKLELLLALEECKGIVTDACRKVGLSRQTHYDYLKDDEDYKLAVEELSNVAIDFVEGKLFEKINGVSIGKYNDKGELIVYEVPPSDTAIIFYLKTKAKKRGYVERQEFTGKDGKDLGKWEIIIQPPNDEDKT